MQLSAVLVILSGVALMTRHLPDCDCVNRSGITHCLLIYIMALYRRVRKDAKRSYHLALQDFKADKQNKELQKRQSKEEKKLKESKQRLDELKAKADVQ